MASSAATMNKRLKDEANRDTPKILNDEVNVLPPPPKSKEKKVTHGRILRKLLGDDALPSANPTIPATDSATIYFPTTVSPATIYSPITTYSPTTFSPAYVCNADPENCGCPHLNQANYCGTINTTNNGKACMRWDDPNLRYRYDLGVDLDNYYPNAGLEENFCRNYDDDLDGPWCFTRAIIRDNDSGIDGEWEYDYCDVPMCDDNSPSVAPSASFIPTSSSKPTLSRPQSLRPTLTTQPTTMPSSSPSNIPSSSLSPTNTCHEDMSKCGGEIFRQSDYRGTISTTKDGAECLRWDTEWMYFSDNAVESLGLNKNFCRNLYNDVNGPGCFTSAEIFDENGLPKFSYCTIPTCDRCSCMPECEQPNLSMCGCPSALQAEKCCDKNDSSCKCTYLKEACRISLENNSTEFCEDADVECCSNEADPNCKCLMYEAICFEYPSQSTCEFAAASCCNTLGYNFIIGTTSKPSA